MSNWKEFVQYYETVEPPPELPLHSFMMDQPAKPLQGKNLVDKLKDWFNRANYNAENTHSNSSLNGKRDEVLPRNTDQKHDNENDLPGKQIYLVEEEPFGVGLNGSQNLAQDSAKTFMTGNNVDANNIPQFPRGIHDNRNVPSQSATGNNAPDTLDIAETYNSLINKPISQILMDPSFLSNLSTSLHAKSVTLRTVTKRLSAVANKKNETSKLMQKFLKDLFFWGQNSAVENSDSVALVNEIQQLFQMDLALEQKISEKLKQLTAELEYICLRQDELSTGKKNLLYALKKYDNSKNKKGEDIEETNLLREKVIAQEKSYEAYKSHYQYSISVTARQIFKDIGIEYYERSSDLKDATGNYLKITLQKLEINNSELFVKDFEKLRILRAERNWSKLNPEEKSNPQSWVDLVSGKYDGNDTLMKKIRKGLPQAYTSTPKNISPKLDFQTGLEESISDTATDRFNPITSNQFFLERSSNEAIPEKVKGDTLEEDNSHTENQARTDHQRVFSDFESEDNNTVTRSLNPKAVLNEMTANRQATLSLRKNHNISVFPKEPESIGKQPDKPPLKQKLSTKNGSNEPGNGFILHFGDISQQFNDAEKNLQENRWAESPL